jgi:hypothetical protein
VPTFQNRSEGEDLTRNLRVSNWTRFRGRVSHNLKRSERPYFP